MADPRPAQRAVDILVSALGLLLLAPVIGVGALAVKLTSPGPVFYRAARAGVGGRSFYMLKLRTMRQAASEGPKITAPGDSRVTPVGRFLRASKIDEMPQLLNVLKGDMSIVGPRPPLPSEVEAYDVRTNRRLNVKPGITGLWQTQGRSNLPWDDGIYLDLMYIDHWSPLLDLVIMARTVRTVLRPDGAY